MGLRSPQREELARLNAKTLDARFTATLREGLNCSPFEAHAVLDVVREVYAPLFADVIDAPLPGRLTVIAVDADEPAGKSVVDCAKRSVCLTVHRGPDDDRLLQDKGAEGFRQARLADLCQDRRFLGAQIGALAVLHTWTRTLGWHPHVHMLGPGGGLASDGETWLPAPKRSKRYLVPTEALSLKFRGRFMALARKALPKGRMPSVPEKKRWVTFAKPVVQGAEQVLEYLGRYVHKTAIGNHAVVAFNERTVTFRYTDSRDHQRRLMTLPAHEFLHRFLQHVPPRGFHRVRHFGLLQSRHRATLRRLQLMLAESQHAEHSVASQQRAELQHPRCPACGQHALVLRRHLTAAECSELTATPGHVDPPGPAKARAPPRPRGSRRTRAA